MADNLSYWESAVDAIIVGSINTAIRAKKAGYDTAIDELAAFLDGNHSEIINTELDTYFGAEQEVNSERKVPEYFPLVPFLVDKLSTWLTKDPIAWLSGPDGTVIQNSDPSVRNLQMLMRETNLQDYWHQGERYRACFWTAFWQIGHREHEVCFDLYRPSQLNIYESMVDPRRVDWAQAIVIPAYIPNWAPSSDTQSFASAADTYHVWSRYRDQRGDLHWGGHLVDRDGSLKVDQSMMAFPDGNNRYKMHPVIRWCEHPAMEGSFVDMDDTLLRAAKNCDLHFSDLGEIVRFDSFGIKVVSGLNSKIDEMPHSPRAWHFVDEAARGGKIEIVGPQAKIAEILSWLNSWLRYNAIFRGLPGNLFDTRTPNITTGAAIGRARIDLSDAREARRESMRRDVRRLLLGARVVWNHHNPSGKIDPSYDIHVGFAGEEQEDPAGRQSESQARKYEYENGSRSIVADHLRAQEVEPRTATPEQWAQARSEVIRWASDNATVRGVVSSDEYRKRQEDREE